ncbi:MAG: HAMP domain-containing sensor histidine kinase [Woeseiaceae bacterium]|nr:HAMP domain-containing sensor histidine kinase [Woeseiaceae bacterium]
MLDRLYRSLSFRLFAIFLVLAGLLVWGALSALRWVYNSDDIRGLISGHLSLHVQYVRDDIGSPPRIDRAIAITERVPVDIRILGPDIDWASDAGFPALADLEFGPSPAFSDNPGAWVDELSGIEFATSGKHRFLKLQSGTYDIVVSTPPISDTMTGPDLTKIIVGMVILFLIFAYAAVNWLFKPIRSIRAGASHIGRGNFDHRIRNIRKDQLGDLAEDINRLAEDVEGMLDAKRALLLGISHELRTPLSRLNLAVEFLDDEKDQETIRAEIAEMEKIVVSLIEAERLNTRHASLNRTQVRLDDLVEELLSDFFTRDRERIKVISNAPNLEASLDEARVKLCLKNLLSNALRYSPESAGPVTLVVDEQDGELVLRVRDRGPGIPPEHAARIGEPFYRGDPSRARQTGGTGLGLYLATLVARAHEGTLRLVDTEVGACFEVRLPLSFSI